MKRLGYHFLLVLCCLGVTACVFSPSLWLYARERPGTVQWDRGLTYLKQCEDPFNQKVEAAMRWRLLPPLVAKGLGLKGKQALLLPYLGLLALGLLTLSILRQHHEAPSFYLGGTFVLTSTSAFLVAIGWLGINDAWVWLGLLTLAFRPETWTLAVACLLAPWVDERFIIGLPLALAVRGMHLGWTRLFVREVVVALVLLVPYTLLRLWLGGNPLSSPSEQSFLRLHLESFINRVPLAPLAWWFGLRAAWLPLAYTFASARRVESLTLGLLAMGTALVSLFLAADMSRSIAILLPLAMLGMLRFAQNHPLLAAQGMRYLALAAFLLPAAQVVYPRIYPITNILVEILRLQRGP